MSDQYDDEMPETDEGPEDFKNMRAAANRAGKLEKENGSLKRENAFLKAGIPMDDPKMSYFVKGYDGELTGEAIRQAALDAGFIAPPAKVEDPAVQQAQQGQAAVVAASAGTAPAFDEDAIQYQMEQAYKEGGLEALSAVTQQYGVRFQPEPI